MQMPHRIPPTTGVSHHLPHRMKSSSKSGNPTTSPPYFHHFLDRNTSINSSSNAFYVNPPTAYGENTSALNNPSGKRPRLGTTSSTTSFLSPFPMYSIPQSFDTDHALPELAVNSGYTNRSNLRSNINNSNATFTASLSSTAMASHGHASSSSFGAIESPNGASMFADPSFLPDYDSSLYSLWNGPGGNVMGYETENVITPNQQQSPLYMTSDDELKMAYPQLPEFNQDLESYLNDSIEPGGPSPTTPLGTTKPNPMMKMGHLMTSDRRNGTGQNVTIGTRESQLEKLLAPASTDDYLLKRDEGTKVENTSKHIGKRSSRDNNDAYAVHPVTSGNTMEASASTNSFRILSRNSTTASLPSQTEESTSLATTVVSTSSAAGLPHSKRPRSRQCEFPGCQNRARSHQKCKKHGGAHQCVFEGCTKNSQSRGLCIAHGGGSRCKKEGCARAAQSKGLCKSHGGGEYCAVEGCNKKAHLRHLCRTHGGGVRCKFAKCLKWAQRKGWCMAHAKEFAAS